MSFFAKKVGRVLSIFLKGKLNSIEAEDDDELNKLISLVRDAHSGNQESLDELEKLLFSKNLKDESLSEVKEKVSVAENALSEAEVDLEEAYLYEKYLSNKDIFHIDGDKFYLKPFINAEMPRVLVQEFANLIRLNKDIQPLLNFWKLALLNENKEARRGLYKFIKNQDLFVTKNGYFVVFRRIVDLNENKFGVSTSDAEHIKNLAIRRKRGFNTTNVIRLSDGSYNISHIKNKPKAGEIIGTVQEVLDYTLNKTFTDAHTRTMSIKIGQAVRIPRHLCDKNPNIECSFGLHVASSKYVYENNFGNVIVACLVNPQHVVSVPYKDAHKMRVCEYLPIFTLDESELLDFEFDDERFNEFADDYKDIELDGVNKAIDFIDDLSERERDEFNSKIPKKVLLDNVDDAEKTLLEAKSELNIAKSTLSYLLNDDITDLLDIESVKLILKSRTHD